MCCYGDSKKVIVVHSAEMSVADVDGCRDPVALSAGERGDRDGGQGWEEDSQYRERVRGQVSK